MVLKIKLRKYSQKYLNFGFTTIEVNDGEKSLSSLCVKTYESEEQHVKVVFKTMLNHLAMLANNFKKYFLGEDNLVASYEWIRDLFQDSSEGLSTSEEEIFIDFTPSEKLKDNFVINRSLNFGYR
ncbi:zinc finger BED domain-containing protein 5 [Trichonephila clavipes]|nr:zinc finger BED domain-containing protein 5 [Trichonephila clavipes]